MMGIVFLYFDLSAMKLDALDCTPHLELSFIAMNSREAFGRHASRNVCQHQIAFERTCCTSATKTDFSASSLQGNIQQFQDFATLDGCQGFSDAFYNAL